MRNNPLSIYLNQIGKIPLLDKAEEKVLIIKAKDGDAEAKNKLINSNLRFVVAIAKKYIRCGIPLPDLINEGNIGLIQAIEKFDIDVGCQFITYAVFWIRQKIIRAMHNKFRMIRLPANKIKKLGDIEKAKKILQIKLNRDPSTNEIACELDISKKEIEYLLKISQRMVSIESSDCTNDEASNLSDFITDNKIDSPEKKAEKNILSQTINSILDTLPDKQKEILQDRFGLNNHKALSLQKIAKMHNVSRERIRQIEKKALSKIRHNPKNFKLKHFMKD